MIAAKSFMMYNIFDNILKYKFDSFKISKCLKMIENILFCSRSQNSKAIDLFKLVRKQLKCMPSR